DKMIQQHSTFVAVGAGHLGEEQGVIELLRQKGYTVLPIIPDYKHYLEDGWFHFYSSRNNFSIDFPGMPAVATDTLNGNNVWRYSLKKDDAAHSDFTVLVFPISMSDESIRNYLAAKNIAEIKLNSGNEEKYFSFQRQDKAKGRCVFVYSG